METTSDGTKIAKTDPVKKMITVKKRIQWAKLLELTWEQLTHVFP